MRGRNTNGGGGNNNNNNNRRGPNPLTRSYESNGPDVKIRGTAQHIAEKYMSLARDSHSSGDRVMAENYLQHAEHYNRIIAAALAQQQAIREQREVEEEDFGEDLDNRFASNIPQPQGQQSEGDQPYDGEQPQPAIEAKSQDAESEGQPRESRPEAPRQNGDGEEGRERNSFRNRRRERAPRPPREPQPAAIAADADQPDAGGLMATLSRGADKPVIATIEE